MRLSIAFFTPNDWENYSGTNAADRWPLRDWTDLKAAENAAFAHGDKIATTMVVIQTEFGQAYYYRREWRRTDA